MDIKPKRYLKKPSEIIAVQFDGTPQNSMVKFREQNKVWQIYNELHDSWINIKTGDFYRVDIKGDYYPIDAEYMKENYTEVK
jgi:hypothetical protein